jgi:hypothetical protein
MTLRRGDIRNWTKADGSRVNWGWLFGAFGPAISPSDIDFIVERRRHFLVGEIKPARNAMTRGQTIMLRELAAVSPCFTIFYLIADIDYEQREITECREILIEGEGHWYPCSRESFRSFCESWYQRANKSGPNQWALWRFGWNGAAP